MKTRLGNYCGRNYCMLRSLVNNVYTYIHVCNIELIYNVWRQHVRKMPNNNGYLRNYYFKITACETLPVRRTMPGWNGKWASVFQTAYPNFRLNFLKQQDLKSLSITTNKSMVVLLRKRCSSEFILSRVCTHGYRFTTTS